MAVTQLNGTDKRQMRPMALPRLRSARSELNDWLQNTSFYTKHAVQVDETVSRVTCHLARHLSTQRLIQKQLDSAQDCHAKQLTRYTPECELV